MTRTVGAALLLGALATLSGCAMCDSCYDYCYPACGGCRGWYVDDCCRAGSAFCRDVPMDATALPPEGTTHEVLPPATSTGETVPPGATTELSPPSDGSETPPATETEPPSTPMTTPPSTDLTPPDTSLDDLFPAPSAQEPSAPPTQTPAAPLPRQGNPAQGNSPASLRPSQSGGGAASPDLLLPPRTPSLPR